MKAKAANLDQIERWMHSVITHPGGVAEGVASPQARAHLDVPLADLQSVIEPSRAMSSCERLEIYVDAYFERLLECLREEFPATRYALGDELFHALAFGYLQHYPSRSYTLNLLGASFPHYLAESRLHASETPPGAPASWPDFVIELADFERTMREVFDGPGIENRPVLDATRLAAVQSDDWADARLVAAPCLRLRQFEHPVHHFWNAAKAGDSPSAPQPGRASLAIHRCDWCVERHELSEAQYVLLERLTQGQPLGAAVAATANLAHLSGQLSAAHLQQWFAKWTAAGFFVAISAESV